MTQYSDLSDLPEDDRISIMGARFMQSDKTNVMFVDDDPNKILRYEKKLQEKFPQLICVGHLRGFSPGVVGIKVRKK